MIVVLKGVDAQYIADHLMGSGYSVSVLTGASPLEERDSFPQYSGSRLVGSCEFDSHVATSVWGHLVESTEWPHGVRGACRIDGHC